MDVLIHLMDVLIHLIRVFQQVRLRSRSRLPVISVIVISTAQHLDTSCSEIPSAPGRKQRLKVSTCG
jgi:hypothetical protein